MIDCENIDMQPGVVKVTDIGLPIEERIVEFDTEVEQSNEYSGNFEITDEDKNAADRYLVQQNVITTQPIRKTMNRSDSLPNYEDVNTDAPGNTPVIYHGIAYEKSAVDLFRRLKPKSDITQETETEHDYCRPGGAHVGNGKSRPRVEYLTSSEGQKPSISCIDIEKLEELKSDDLDIYVPMSMLNHHQRRDVWMLQQCIKQQ